MVSATRKRKAAQKKEPAAAKRGGKSALAASSKASAAAENGAGELADGVSALQISDTGVRIESLEENQMQYKWEQEPAAASEIRCSENGSIMEEIKALMNESLMSKNSRKKDRMGQMEAYTLLEAKEASLLEQEKLRSALECSEKEARDAAEKLQTSLSAAQLCIRWLLEANEASLLEQEKLRSALECSEKEARDAAEKLQISLSAELEKIRQEKLAADQKVSKTQEYNMSLHQYNSKLQIELETAIESRTTLLNNITTLQEKLMSSINMANFPASETRTEVEELKRIRSDLQERLAKAELEGEKLRETRTEVEELKRIRSDLQERLAKAELQVVEGENLRKKLHNTIMELKGNIRFFCRVRPLLPDERSGSENNFISYPTSMEALGRGIDVAQSGQKYPFIFDKVFTHEASQQDVFVEISQLVQSVLDGYKVCIFAYGQTGSGKTYTMMGKPQVTEQKGLIPRSLEQIFETTQALESQGWKYNMQATMLEIYNETIRDLLVTNESSNPDMAGVSGKQKKISHDASGNIVISDLTIIDVCSIKEISALLHQAAQKRSVGKTQMNEQSSRSHFLFTLRISGVNEVTEQQVQGILNLIDLAGSERLSKSGADGDRLKETQNINKSLASLSNVIFSLAKKEDFVPFRNSKLTYLLQPCLGEDSKTLMLVNISPELSSVGESLCSLRYAARVNSCETGIPRRQTNRPPVDNSSGYG